MIQLLTGMLKSQLNVTFPMQPELSSVIRNGSQLQMLSYGNGAVIIIIIIH